MKSRFRKFLTLLWLGLFCLEGWAHGFIEIDPRSLPKIDYPPIGIDIDALRGYGNVAREAGKRLVDQGEAVLGQAHATLLQPGIPFPQKMQLVTVLGEIADPGSADVIIEVAESTPNKYLFQNALLALARFEPTGDIIDFVDRQLEEPANNPLVLRSALGYYAIQPREDAKQWVEQYGGNSTREDVRYAALFLGGKLGMVSVKDGIVEMLQQKQGIARQYYLLSGLTEIVGVDEFNRLTQNIDIYSRNQRRIQSVLDFKMAGDAGRLELAKNSLSSADSVLKRAGVDYLIKANKPEVLAKHWLFNDPYVRPAVRRQGYEIDLGDKGPRFTEIYRPNTLRELLPWLWLVLGLPLVWLIYKRIRA